MSILQLYWKMWRILPEHNKKKIRFIVIGAFNTLWGLSAYPIMYFFLTPLKLHYLVILLINYIINMNVAFLTNKYFVFKTTGNHLQEYGRFAFLQVVCFIINLAALPALVEFAGIKPIYAQSLFVFFVIVSSYLWHNKITFAPKQTEK